MTMVLSDAKDTCFRMNKSSTPVNVQGGRSSFLFIIPWVQSLPLVEAAPTESMTYFSIILVTSFLVSESRYNFYS